MRRSASTSTPACASSTRCARARLLFPDERQPATTLDAVMPAAAPATGTPPRPLEAPNAKVGARAGGQARRRSTQAMMAYQPDSAEFDHIQAYRYVSTGKRPPNWIPPIVCSRATASAELRAVVHGLGSFASVGVSGSPACAGAGLRWQRRHDVRLVAGLLLVIEGRRPAPAARMRLIGLGEHPPRPRSRTPGRRSTPAPCRSAGSRRTSRRVRTGTRRSPQRSS